MIFKTGSSSATKKIAKDLVGKIIKKTPPNKIEGALVFGLVGELGSGKTTFVQGFAKALGIKNPITSPTFLIFRSYPIKRGGYKKLIHVDAYRIKNTAELKTLRFENELKNPKNIVLIEWAEKIKKVLPEKKEIVWFSHGKKSKNERIVRFSKKI